MPLTQDYIEMITKMMSNCKVELEKKIVNAQWLQMYEDFISSGMGRQTMENLVLGMSERDLISFELDDFLAELDLRDYIKVISL